MRILPRRFCQSRASRSASLASSPAATMRSASFSALLSRKLFHRKGLLWFHRHFLTTFVSRRSCQNRGSRSASSASSSGATSLLAPLSSCPSSFGFTAFSYGTAKRTRSLSLILSQVLSKPRVAERKFGILSGCDHAFCIGCIRGWRSGDHTTPGMDLNAVVRSCPVCRQQSYFVTPSVVSQLFCFFLCLSEFPLRPVFVGYSLAFVDFFLCLIGLVFSAFMRSCPLCRHQLYLLRHAVFW